MTVAFADLVDFTSLTSDMPPQEVVTFLNGLFTRFDAAAQEVGVESPKLSLTDTSVPPSKVRTATEELQASSVYESGGQDFELFPARQFSDICRLSIVHAPLAAAIKAVCASALHNPARFRP